MSLQLGYQTGSLDRRPELILVSGQLGLDTSTGRLGTVRLESAEDIVIGTERFLEIFESDSLTVLGLAALPHSVVGGVDAHVFFAADQRSEEHTSELQSRQYLVCRLLLEKKKTLFTQACHKSLLVLSHLLTHCSRSITE